MEQITFTETQHYQDMDEPHEFCDCGSTMFQSQEDCKQGIIYCDGLYQYSLTTRERSYKQDAEVIKYTPKSPVFSAIGQCPYQGNQKKTEKIQKIVSEYNNMRFETFDKSLQPHAFDVAKSFNGITKLILGGTTGLGKTHLARASYIQLLEGFKDCRWFKANDLAELFRRIQSYSDDVQDKNKANDLYRKAILCDCLYLDDLGSERETKTELFTEQFKSFLEELSGGLMITTNLDSVSIKERYGEKIYSRLFEGAEAIRLKGEDYRSRTFPKLK